MIKSNAAFLRILAGRALAASGDDTFHRLTDIDPVPGWTDGVGAAATVVAGQGLEPSYCLTDEILWQRFAVVSARRLFAFTEVETVAASSSRGDPEHGPASPEAKPILRIDAEVTLHCGTVVAVPAAGQWLLTFLRRCARYRTDR